MRTTPLDEVPEALGQPTGHVVGVVLVSVQHQGGQVEYDVTVQRRIVAQVVLGQVRDRHQGVALDHVPALGALDGQAEVRLQEGHLGRAGGQDEQLVLALLPEVRAFTEVGLAEQLGLGRGREGGLFELKDLEPAIPGLLHALGVEVGP